MVKAKISREKKKISMKQPLEVLPVKEERVLFEWQALERPYQRKNREFWTTTLSILGLICLILFFVKEWFLIVALIALVFLYYVLTTIPPQKTKYKITTKGVYLTSSQRVDWDLLRRFWFDQKWGHRLLHLETWLDFPQVISFVVTKEDEKKISQIIKKYLPQEESSPNFLDKLSSWLAKKFPIESN